MPASPQMELYYSLTPFRSCRSESNRSNRAGVTVDSQEFSFYLTHYYSCPHLTVSEFKKSTNSASIVSLSTIVDAEVSDPTHGCCSRRE